MRALSITLALAGLAGGTALIAWFGADRVVEAVLSVGWGGFAVLCAWQMLLFAILALAWSVLVPGPYRRRFGVLLWGRMVRDSATNCLPFSPIGGFVLGARAVTLHGIPWPVAAATTVVDVTAEVIAQIAFAAIGLCILLAEEPQSELAPPIAAGVGLALAGMAAFIWAQQGAGTVFARLGPRIAGAWFEKAEGQVGALQSELSRIYARPGRLALSAAIHLAGWLATAFADWIAFHLLGADIDLIDVLALDALLHAALGVAFIVPGGIGVQEAAYAGLGAIFGIPPDLALGASLLRRARDLALGVPILLAWQGLEVRRLRARPDAASRNGQPTA